MINTLGPRVYQQPIVRSMAAPQTAPTAPQTVAQPPAMPQAQSAGTDLGAMLTGFFTKLAQALSTFFRTLFGSGQAPSGQNGQSVNSVTTPTQPAIVITPETRMAAQQALPHIDLLTQHVAMLKPTLEMLQVKKPSPSEILSFLMEAKIALTNVSQGLQPNFRSQTVGVSSLGNDMLKFSTDTLGVVMAAKGLASLFQVKDANVLKTIGDIEAGLMSVRTAADILSRNPV